MIRARAVLFDWDGTLLDSAAATYRGYRRLFSEYALPFDETDFERTYCPDWYRTYEAIGLPRAAWIEADQRWLQLYAQEPPELRPHARDTLSQLSRIGWPLGLVTSGQRERVIADLERLDLRGRFAAVVCGTDLMERKPDPAPLRRALGEMGVASADAVYVGDSPEDVGMAHAAGAAAIAVPGGYPNRTELAAACADVFIEDLRELLPALRRDAERNEKK